MARTRLDRRALGELGDASQEPGAVIEAGSCWFSAGRGERQAGEGTYVDSLPRTPAAMLSRTACSTKAWTSRPAAAHSSGTGTAMSEASGVGSVMARSVSVQKRIEGSASKRRE
jgi:hypothetical protein